MISSDAVNAAWNEAKRIGLTGLPNDFRRVVEAAIRVDSWKPIETAPRDGTHILAVLCRDACFDMDDIRRAAFSEVREIWYKPYDQFGMFLPWHAGDPFDSHDGMAPEHFGEAVPIYWRAIPAFPRMKDSTR